MNDNNEYAHLDRKMDAVLECLRQLLQSQHTLFTHLGELMSNVSDLNVAEARLAADVSQQTADIALIQDNLTTQLGQLAAEIQALQQQQPTLDLTNVTMSINQIETNHAALLALAKQAAGVDTIPPPAPIVPVTTPVDPAPAPPPVDVPVVVEVPPVDPPPPPPVDVAPPPVDQSPVEPPVEPPPTAS